MNDLVIDFVPDFYRDAKNTSHVISVTLIANVGHYKIIG